MRAYVLKCYGGPDAAEFTDFPEPAAPGPTGLLIDVKAAGLNPVDYKFREGKLRAIMRPKLPMVLGNEIAGTVAAVGRDVTDFQPGDRIYARLGKEGGGAFADRALVDQAFAAIAPATLDDAAAAAVPLAGLTALQALRDVLNVQPGQRVLISGGAGGVGTFAIQLAKWMGAHVTTTASPRGTALVRELGADAVVDYTAQSISDLLRDFDAGFDLIGGETLDQMFTVVKPGRTVVSIAATPEPQTALRDLGRGPVLAALFWLVSRKLRGRAARAGVRYRFLFMHPDGAGLATLARLIDEGSLRVIVDQQYPFADIAQAMATLETGRAKGKIVVTMAD